MTRMVWLGIVHPADSQCTDSRVFEREWKAQQQAFQSLRLKPAGTQRSFEPAEVFRQFSGPAQAPAGLPGMFEGEDFGVQGLPREIDARAGDVRSAKSRVV